MSPPSLPGVCELVTVAGRDAVGPPRLLIEIPHGATRTSEFTALAQQLEGPFPDGLADFFHVNTDAGAPELGLALARHLVEAQPTWNVRVVRACVPRTFVDCNRVLDVSPEAYREGKVTPGMPPYVRSAADKERLVALHRAYVEVVTAAMAEVCGAGGHALFLHTYAPRSVDVEVDDDIVAALRRAYLPEVVGTWPLRPEVDVIGRGIDGARHVHEALFAGIRSALATVGVTAEDGATYPLHPSTQAFHHAAHHPGRTLCVEVRRDLLADPFEPFAQMAISPAKVERIAAPLASALVGWIAG